MIYSKKNSPKEYLQKINNYKKIHQNGFQRLDKFICKEEAYGGISARPFVNIIKKIIFLSIACYEASTLLPNDRDAHINIQIYDW